MLAGAYAYLFTIKSSMTVNKAAATHKAKVLRGTFDLLLAAALLTSHGPSLDTSGIPDESALGPW